MPANKNAQYRYQILDRCFSDFSHKYDIDDLLKIVNEHLINDSVDGSVIQKRQLRDDLNAIRNMLPEDVYLDAKPFQGKKCYYRYSKRNYSIYNNELSAEEVRALHSTIDVLSRFRGAPGNSWLEEIISKLEYRFGIKSNSINPVSFEQNTLLKGLEYLSVLIDAVVNKTPLVISYKTYRGKEINTTVHPYHVKQYNNRWFLFGYEEETEKIANKALDRIQHISSSNVPFKQNDTVDFVHLFDDFVGVSIPGEDVKKETVLLRFTENRFPYVTSKPIHHSQKVVSESECTISLEVKPTRELEQQILSFGSDVEVLSPESFRNQVSENIEETYKKYFPVQKECTEE